MGQQTINLGSAPNTHDGDTARDAGAKINANFSELYLFNASVPDAIAAAAAGAVSEHVLAEDPHIQYLTEERGNGLYAPIIGTGTLGVTFGGGNTGLTASGTLAYVKIGDLVFLTGLITLSAKGSSTGAMEITGLPFTIGDMDCVLAVGNWANMTSVVGNLMLSGAANGDTLAVKQGGATGAAAVSNSQASNTTQIQFSGCYRAAPAD